MELVQAGLRTLAVTILLLSVIAPGMLRAEAEATVDATTEELLAQGREALVSGDPTRAREIFQAVLERRPGDVESLYNLASLALLAGRSREAEACYRQLLLHPPEASEARFNLGVLASEAGRLDEAVAHFRQVAEERPDYPRAWMALGECLEKSGDLRQAVLAYATAADLVPEDPLPWRERAGLLLRMGRPEEALTAAVEAHRLDPEDPVPLELRAELLRSRGEGVAAEMADREALVAWEQEEGPQAAYHRARLLHRFGEKARAEEELRRCLAEHPLHPEGLALAREFEGFEATRVSRSSRLEEDLFRSDRSGSTAGSVPGAGP